MKVKKSFVIVIQQSLENMKNLAVIFFEMSCLVFLSVSPTGQTLSFSLEFTNANAGSFIVLRKVDGLYS